MRDAGKRLFTALRRDATPSRTRDLIAVYKGAIDADKERRVAAQTSLDAKSDSASIPASKRRSGSSVC